MFRMTWAALAVLMTTLVVTVAPAGAKSHPKSQTLCERAYSVRTVVKKRHGARAPGRNICRFGVQSKFNAAWDRPATVREKATYLRALRALIAPTHRPLLARIAVPPANAPAGTLTPSVRGTGAGGSSNAYVNPNCESGGDPTTDTDNGYYGKYQFDTQTWNRFGGSGNPAHASEAEQDRVAANVTYDAWPNC